MKKGDAGAPIISVLLPVHNAEPYLAEALDSLLAQTFQEFEIIAIDDGSTDGSGEILDVYAERDPRIRVFHRSQRGLVQTLNEGIDLACGKWIARMDADDIALPHRFAVQLANLERTGADFCGGAIECFGDWAAVYRYPESHDGCEVQLLFGVPFAHPAVMGRRQAFDILRYSEEYTYAEDYDCWQRAWTIGYRFANVPDVVLKYRVHAKQVSFQSQNTQYIKADLVRKRHWGHMFPNLDAHFIARTIDAMREGVGKTEWFTQILADLLEDRSASAQEVLLFNSYKVFCKLAGQDYAAAKNWLLLTQHASVRRYVRDYRRATVLAMLSLLHIGFDSKFYRYLHRVWAAIGTRIPVSRSKW